MQSKKTKSLVTIGLPVFNGGDYLLSAIKSIMLQSWTNWELLLFDDGSTDGSLENLPFLDDARIALIRDGFNLGISRRLNQAVDMANGEYFARMDHDDICHPKRLERQLMYLEQNKNVDVVCSRCVTIDTQTNLVGSLPYAKGHHSICKAPWRGFLMPHPTWFGRIEWFRENRYSEPGPFRCEDQELILRTYSKSKFHTIPESLLAYRKSDAVKIQLLIKTNIAWFFVQARNFYLQKFFLWIFLSFVVTLLRVMKSAFSAHILSSIKSTQKSRCCNKKSSEECIVWQKIFNKVSKAS